MLLTPDKRQVNVRLGIGTPVGGSLDNSSTADKTELELR